jgi:hypothetical protein
MARYIPRFESIECLYLHSKLWRQCLFDPTRYPKRVKKMDSASMSGKTPKFFTECNGVAVLICSVAIFC